MNCYFFALHELKMSKCPPEVAVLSDTLPEEAERSQQSG